jgi:hypothetical protein
MKQISINRVFYVVFSDINLISCNLARDPDFNIFLFLVCLKKLKILYFAHIYYS